MIKTQHNFDFDKKIKYPDLVQNYLDKGDLFLTIETTGLSPERNRIISVSMAEIDTEDSELSDEAFDKEIQTITLFSESRDDELSVIEAALKKIKDASRIITWNGAAFDFKFLSTRCEAYAKKLDYNTSSLKTGGKELPLYDLSKLLRPLKRLTNDESLSIYTLLEEMGLSDTTLPDGRTVTTLYKTWENTGEKKYAEPIIDHSIYKLTGIINLLALLECLKINRVKPEINELTSDTDKTATPDEKDTITATGTTDLFFPIPLTFTLPGIHLTFDKNAFECVFYLKGGCIRIYYTDASSYVRLRENGQLIPKELSKTLSKDAYEKVTRETCYTLSTLPSDKTKAKKQLENYIRQLVMM